MAGQLKVITPMPLPLCVFFRKEMECFTCLECSLNVNEAYFLDFFFSKQEKLEELMDFFQASKRYHLSKRFGHREYLVQNMQSSETRVQGLLSAADTQLTVFIQKHER